MAAKVVFEVDLQVAAPPRDVWSLLTDWGAHGEFIPATRIEFHSEVVDAVGTEFTAFTGFGPLTLEDRMRVTQLDWDDATTSGYCEVEKLGPLLAGRADFRVAAGPKGTTVTWLEDLTIDKLPGPLGSMVGFGAGFGFRLVGVLLGRELRQRRTIS